MPRNKKVVSNLRSALSTLCVHVSPRSLAAFLKLRVANLFLLRFRMQVIQKNAVARFIWKQLVAPTNLSIGKIWPCLKTSSDLRKMMMVSKTPTSNSARERVFQHLSGLLRVQRSRRSNTGSRFALIAFKSAS